MPEKLRRVRFKDPDSSRDLVFLTNRTDVDPPPIRNLKRTRLPSAASFREPLWLSLGTRPLGNNPATSGSLWPPSHRIWEPRNSAWNRRAGPDSCAACPGKIRSACARPDRQLQRELLSGSRARSKAPARGSSSATTKRPSRSSQPPKSLTVQ